MSESNKVRLLKAAKEFNVTLDIIVEFLTTKGTPIDRNPNAMLNDNQYRMLVSEYHADKEIREKASKIQIGRSHREDVSIVEKNKTTSTPTEEDEPREILIKNFDTQTHVEKTVESKVEATPEISKTEESPKSTLETEPTPEATADKSGLNVIRTIDLSTLNKPKKGNKPKTEAVKTESATPVKVEEASIPKEETPVIETPKAEQPIAETTPIVDKPVVQEIKETVTPIVEVEKKHTKATLEKVSESESVKTTESKKETPKVEKTKDKVDIKPIEKVSEIKAEITETPKGEEDEDVIRAKAGTLKGPTILGKIDLSQFEKKKSVPVASSAEGALGKRKRKRKEAPKAPGAPAAPGAPRTGYQGNKPGGVGGARPPFNKPGGARPPFNKPGAPGTGGTGKVFTKPEPTEKEIQDQIKATLARLQGGSGKKGASRQQHKKDKRTRHHNRNSESVEEGENQILQTTEFLTTSEFAQLMDVGVTDVISTCMTLGLMVSINQRLDAETIQIVADEFGFTVEFVSADAELDNLEEVDNPENLQSRPPIVTIMGHVDHGKTSLLDYIRKTNVIGGEAGGITQHIGAYEVKLENGKKITFLDTPGHEAFTAMRARGAKVTDIVVIVIAADDSIMPQTREAISHALAASVPIVFAYNKIDKDGANPDKIREQLSQMDLLVESWGGKYQEQEISAKKGLNIDALLEKILLEAEILELKADSKKRASGTVIEATLDKGKGIITTLLVQGGTLYVGDVILAGQHYAKIKAMANERGVRIKSAGPSVPVQVLGFSGAPQAGEKFYQTEEEAQAKDIATKRQQLIREQGIRTKKHITLDEIGRRLAIGDFKELNIIVKGDVDGSVEALADSLQRLSKPEIQVNIIHKGVGQISESDVLLATASDAIIIGFQVRPLPSARKLAEQEEIDIRLYSIIYDAIDEIKSAMVGMLAPKFEEKIVCNVRINEIFKISKVGTIAGCLVLDGKVHRSTKIRVVRNGIVIHTGELESLKRYKDDVKEINAGYECGLNILGFNDIQVDDIIEGFEKVEIKQKL